MEGVHATGTKPCHARCQRALFARKIRSHKAPDIQTSPRAAKARPHAAPPPGSVKDGAEGKGRKESHPEACKGIDGQRQAPLLLRRFVNESGREGPAVKEARHAIEKA